MKPKVIALVGPTASGKSALGVYLAQKLKGEILSADSRQVYKGLTIGTGKISKKEMRGVPHHLLDLVSPKKQFTVDDYVKQGKKILPKISIPIVVGGTGLYVDMLLERMGYPNVPPNFKLRKSLEKYPAPQLLKKLHLLDPRRAKTIEPQNKRRIIRAIEIAKALGKVPLANPASPYEVLWLGLSPSPTKLRKNIRIRLDARLRAGMIQEAKTLFRKGVSYKRMEELGLEYRYLARLLQGKLSKKNFGLQLEKEINRYAKRQMRWFKRNKDIHWVKNKSEALKLAKKFLSGHK